MTGPDSSRDDLLTVSDQATARIVLQEPRRRFLEPFVGRERSTAQAARELGVPVEQMAYRVQAMVRAGLVHEAGRRARAGRAVVSYRAPAEIRAPLLVLSEGDVRDFFRTVDEPMRELFLQALAHRAGRAGLGDWVVRLYRDDEARIRVDLAPEGGAWNPAVLLADDAPAVAFNWVPLVLSREGAKQLQRELTTLLGRYSPHAPRPGQEPTHVLGLFLAPIA